MIVQFQNIDLVLATVLVIDALVRAEDKITSPCPDQEAE
jgi:hypothetical protein